MAAIPLGDAMALEATNIICMIWIIQGYYIDNQLIEVNKFKSSSTKVCILDYCY